MMKRIQIIDSHTGGEPTRLVVSGFPALGSGTMAERRDVLAREHDRYRTACILEPRGSDVLVGALLCEPVSPDAAAGVIFFNNSGYLGMCGHGTIGVVRTLHHMGRIAPGVHRIETPVGTVEATLHDDLSVSVRNVPAYRHAKGVALDVPGYGPVKGDVAWGGNWFFLISDHGQRVAGDNVAALTAYASAVRETERAASPARTAARSTISNCSPTIPNTTAAASCCARARVRPLTVRHRHDAKLACLAADGKLEPGAVWRQASVIGSVFQASYEQADGGIVPTIRGSAHLSAEATLLIEEDDPFGWGIAP